MPRPARYAAFCLLAPLALSFTAPIPARAQEAQDMPAAPAPAPREFVSRHEGVFGGRKIAYTATAGDTIVKLENGKMARIFAFSYVQNDRKDPNRPVTFVFNGGPGTASVWLHMGAFGPRRVKLPDDNASAGLPPYTLENNADSLLDVTDLVFIDPVGAGYSRAIPPTDDGKFYNLIDDADSFTQFVQNWRIRNGRQNSPLYILGESYGSVRAGVMVRNLRRGVAKIVPNGVILLGQDMDTTITQQTPGNDMPFVLYLPTYAVTAWYHNKVPRNGRTLEQVYAEAREFAYKDLQSALFLGSALPASERTRIAARMAEMTGLPQALIERENLRVGTAVFLRELLRDERRILIRSDTRFTTPATEVYHDKEAITDVPGLVEAFQSAGAAYYRQELGVTLPDLFDLDGPETWDYSLPDGINVQQTYHDVTPYVAAAMRDNPGMRLFFGSGEYDLMAAPLSVERNYTHGGIPLDRVTAKTYPAGHMIFISKSSLGKLSKDVRDFIVAGMR